MRKELSPFTTTIIVIVVLLVAGAVLSYQWQRGGKDKPMSAAEAMEAGRKQGIADAAAKGLPPPKDPPKPTVIPGPGSSTMPPGAIPTTPSAGSKSGN